MGKLNELYGLTEVYQHDINDTTHKCKKCYKTIEELNGALKLCPVMGAEEVAKFRDYDER